MIAIPEFQLGRLTEKPDEDISARYLEGLEAGAYADFDAGENNVLTWTKGNIRAADLPTYKSVFTAGKYRVIQVPIGGPTQSWRLGLKQSVNEPTLQPVLRISFEEEQSEKVMSAASPLQYCYNEALQYEAEGRRDQAIDIIFSEIDKLFRHDQFDACNRFLGAVNVETLSANLVVALLTITLPASQRLPERARLFERVKNRFKDRPDCDKLLSGLEGPPPNGPRFY